MSSKRLSGNAARPNHAYSVHLITHPEPAPKTIGRGAGGVENMRAYGTSNLVLSQAPEGLQLNAAYACSSASESSVEHQMLDPETETETEAEMEVESDPDVASFRHGAMTRPSAPQPAPTTASREVQGRSMVSGGRAKYRYFSMREVARHQSSGDCWLVAHGKVYDVTPFLDQHPAGERAIMRHAGTDSTTDFDFHSKSARKMWAPYMIGYLEDHQACAIS